MVKFRRISYHEVDLLKSMTLRKADIEELRASTGIQDAWLALKYSVEHSTEWTEIGYYPDTGEVITVFGLSSHEDIGVPWMIGSPSMLKHKKLLMRYSVKIIKEMLTQFRVLANYVDSRNEVHIRWLKHMGFIFEGNPFTINGVPFLYFYKRRND